MNPQQKFINTMLAKASASPDKPREVQEIDMGIYRGGAPPQRQRSIDSDDFMPEQQNEPQKKPAPKRPRSKKATQPKGYKSEQIKRLKTDAF